MELHYTYFTTPPSLKTAAGWGAPHAAAGRARAAEQAQRGGGAHLERRHPAGEREGEGGVDGEGHGEVAHELVQQRELLPVRRDLLE